MRHAVVRALIAAFCLVSSGSTLAADHPPQPAANMREPLYHVTMGEARDIPLVVVNGGPGFAHDYLADAPLWKDVSARRQLVFYDQRGTGRSPKASSASDLSVAAMVEDLENLRRDLKVDRIDLLGHSWGGILAMAYATRHPSHVAHLVVVGSGDPKPSEHEFLWDKLFPEIVSTLSKDPSPAGQMGCVQIEAYDRMSYYDERNRSRVEARGKDSFSSETCTTVMLDAMKLDLYPELRRLKVPTLVINGRFDANVAPTVAYKISQAIPEARLVFFERSGHSPFLEEPEKFILEVERFLGADKGRSGP